MKARFLLFASLSLLSSCGAKQETKNAVVKPVKVAVAQSLSSVSKTYAAEVLSDEVSNLAFKVQGQIVTMNVDEGQSVKKGDLIAKIDNRDYLLQYEANKSSYLTAKAQLERFTRLLQKQAVSQQDFEIAQTKYDQAKAQYEKSQNDLQDALLIAPFNGTVEKRFVQNFQRIQAGESIIRLVNTGRPYVMFTVADYNLMSLKDSKPTFFVRINRSQDKLFKTRIKEIYDISIDGSGLPVSLYIDDPEFKPYMNDLKPGFACEVVAFFAFSNRPNGVSVPITAVFDDPATNETCTWVVVDGKLQRRVVKLGELYGKDMIVVTEGLAAGETVISAGSLTLQAGQAVKIMN